MLTGQSVSLGNGEKRGREMGEREREREKKKREKKEEKMKRGEIAKGNEKNFTAQFLLLPDPIIRFCI